jgi:hypothetical protein
MKSTRLLPDKLLTKICADDAPAGNGAAMLKQIRRITIFVLGMSVLLVGIVMIFAPGPAFIVIPAGLAILATEFVWAQKILEALKKRLVPTKETPDAAVSDGSSTRRHAG